MFGDKLRTAGEAASDLHGEHDALHGLFDELTRVEGLGELRELLGRLQPALEAHFEREERPSGLYESLGAFEPELRDQLQELVQDHLHLRRTVAHLVRSVEGARLADLDGLLAEAHYLASSLKEHEAAEHALASDALARPPRD